jgi:hypothetical protein
MADDSLDQLVLAALRTVAGPERRDAGLSPALADAAREIQGLRSANLALAEVVESNTRAVTRRPASASDSDGRSITGTIASTVFSSGLGLAPLASAIVGLFRGDRREEPAPLIEYVAPARLRLEVANPESASRGIVEFPSVSRGQDGLPRVPITAGPQISISVNAMDSRSFLDHRHEIAQAVRQAMLDSHALNDVVSDL